MDAQAAADEHRDESREKQDVEPGHHVVGGPVVEVPERRDQQRVVRRMEIGQHDKAGRILAGDLQFDLALHSDVVNGGTAVRDIEFGGRIEVEEVGPPEVPAHE